MTNKSMFIVLILLLCTSQTMGGNPNCPNCGSIAVPYPLSTLPSCGDQSYKLRCTNGKLWLDTLNSSTYQVISVTPNMQRLIIQPQSFIGKSCINTDFRNGGIWLDEKLPFSISAENTVLKLNCTDLATQSAMNCSANSICYRALDLGEEGKVGAVTK